MRAESWVEREERWELESEIANVTRAALMLDVKRNKEQGADDKRG